MTDCNVILPHTHDFTEEVIANMDVWPYCCFMHIFHPLRQKNPARLTFQMLRRIAFHQSILVIPWELTQHALNQAWASILAVQGALGYPPTILFGPWCWSMARLPSPSSSLSPSSSTNADTAEWASINLNLILPGAKGVRITGRPSAIDPAVVVAERPEGIDPNLWPSSILCLHFLVYKQLEPHMPRYLSQPKL